MQCNVPLHVRSCHMYDECYRDNTNHTFHVNIFKHMYISINTTTKHVIQNQAMTPKSPHFQTSKNGHNRPQNKAQIRPKTVVNQSRSNPPNGPYLGHKHPQKSGHTTSPGSVVPKTKSDHKTGLRLSKNCPNSSLSQPQG